MHPALWIFLALLAVLVLLAVLFELRTRRVVQRYGPYIRRVFDETPIFSPDEGTPAAGVEEIELRTRDGVMLRGSYLPAESRPPRGLVVFCHEYLSTRWSGTAYWEFLRSDGCDIFAFDFRNHGSSGSDPTYTPRHWVTDYELCDLQAVLEYLKTRPGSAGLAIGLYGISRGGGAAIGVAASDRSIRCVLTDGAFPTHGTVLAYMKRWMPLAVGEGVLYRLMAWLLPDWYLALLRDRVLASVARDTNCRFPKLERLIRRIAPRPILMIHGGRDSYITQDIAEAFFRCAREPRELWIVEGARHNACLETAGDTYRARVREFFRAHLRGTHG